MKKIILFSLIVLLTGGIAWAGGKGSSKPAPREYSFEDLKQESYDDRWAFSFYPYYKPNEAVASLPGKSPDGDSIGVTSAKISSIRAYGGYKFISFPWDDTRMREGSIVFLKCGDAASRLISYFSTWTHTAMVYNKWSGKSFESQKSDGVNLYNYKSAWIRILAYSVKEVKVSNPMAAVENAVRNFSGKKKYFPSVSTAALSRRDFFKKWGDKWDTDSMYCSKLVWWTFKDYTDLDANRTTSYLYGQWQNLNMDFNVRNWNAWIGVSPDDVYYSKNVGTDILLAGESNLKEPLADSIF